MQTWAGLPNEADFFLNLEGNDSLKLFGWREERKKESLQVGGSYVYKPRSSANRHFCRKQDLLTVDAQT